MRKKIACIVILLALSIVTNAQQVSLFDKNGEATAYIDYDKEAAIFLWDGTPVAFLVKGGIMGVNRKFLGWYDNGIVCDMKGNIVGCMKDKISRYYKFERNKSIQKMTPIK